jgi:UDP-N-acetylmuramoyl-tripeptide--D-alanyl-D-alanine ligase
MISFKELKEIEIENYLGEEREIEHLSFFTDTRTYKNEDVFIAIEGEKFKPLDFIENIPKKCIIVCENTKKNIEIINKNSKRNFIVVKDSIRALGQIAGKISKKFQTSGGKLIAISGSNGKTTTKEMLFHILSNKNNTVCTQKNNNNHIGVPITLFQIKADTKFCIVELGSNHPGEIKYLVDMIEPDFGVCTNIGETHLEFFKSLENVFIEESYLLKYLTENSKTAFINLDDDFLESYKKFDSAVTYSCYDDANYNFKITNSELVMSFDKKNVSFENNNITGKHNKLNLLVAAMICNKLGVAEKEIINQSSSFVPTSNRSQWIDFDNSKIFLDAYNANPSSMRAAIYAFKDYCDKNNLKKDQFALILGDMNELGEDSHQFHIDLGKFCATNGFLNLYFVGRFAHEYNKGCNYIGTEFLDTGQLRAKVKTIAQMHKAILIKGSRSLQLESAVDITLC